MTREQYAKLTEKEINRIIAKHDGYTSLCDEYGTGQWEKDRRAVDPPDYLNDLNACHEFENCLLNDATHNQTNEYLYMLSWLCGESHNVWCNTVMATAAQRCEAFVLTMEK